MKIAIDVSQMIYDTGVSVYTRNLVRSLLMMDKDNKYLIIGGSLRRYQELKTRIETLIENRKNASSNIYPISPSMADFIINRFDFLNIDHLIGEIDVFHSSDWAQPKTKSYSVTTVHDLIAITQPKLCHPKVVDVQKRRLERVLKLCDSIITPSQTTKTDLIKYGFSDKSITVIPEAVDADFVKPSTEEMEIVRRKYRLHGKYLLAVGANPRKNVERIIFAFEKIRHEFPLKLVVIGEISKPLPTRNVIYLGHVPAVDVAKLYAASEALVYPSLYEGFGLPILEAFSMGVPVLTSDSGSLKEISGNAAVLVNPTDVDDISDGIIKLLSDRKRYIFAGKQEAKKYSWKNVAVQTLNVYKHYKK